MSTTHEVRIPDIGTDDKVGVVELLVAVGDTVQAEDGLITLESDKASMDIPAPANGVVEAIHVAIGDQVAQGDLVVTLSGAASEPAKAKPTSKPKPAAAAASTPTPSATPEPASDADQHAQLLVLGGGPGGYTAAFRAADLGLQVVLVERYPKLGGVCLNVGCIPSKALLHVARVIDEAAALGAHGVSFGKPTIDLDKLRGFKDGVVDKLTTGLSGLARRRKVEIVEGLGRFVSPHRLEVETSEGTRSISFDSAIIAAGSRVSQIPGFPLSDPRVFDSTGALALADVPERLLLIGGGIIGLEMAMVYGALGSQLTVVELLDGLMPGCDRDLVKPLLQRLRKELGATIHLETKVTRIDTEGALVAHMEGPGGSQTAEFDRILMAVGRRPNGDRLEAQNAGIAVDERGYIAVDRQMRSNVPHIFAVGDIVPGPMLAHKATHQGKVAAEVIAGQKSAFDARVIPSVAYTDPEIAWVGLTETEAAAQGVAYEKGSFPWAASGRALGIGRPEGLTKLLFDPKTQRILGAGIVGPGAGDLIAELALAIEMDCEASDIGLTIHPHPTLSETIGLSAEAYEGTITDLYLPKKR